MKQKANFQRRKSQQLGKKDQSHEQHIDKDIEKLCRRINSNPDFYTTSSCSGRISLIEWSEKKKPGLFLYKTHDKISFKELKKQLKSAQKTNKLIYFKQEPCLINIACRTLSQAQELIDNARKIGWKRSGIMASEKRFICELMNTENIALPVVNKGRILLSDSYLKLLVKESNSKLARTREKIKKLEKIF